MIARLSPMLKFRNRLGLLLLIAILVLLTALPASAASPDVLAAKIKIMDFSFTPNSVTVAVGSKVGWKNFGPSDHTTTSDTGLWDSGTMVPGQIFAVTFRRAGTYTYHCAIHPTMTGTVIVQ